MKKTKNKIKIALCCLVLVGVSSIQAATIGIGSAFGTFLDKDGVALTTGGVSIGFFTGTLPTAAAIGNISSTTPISFSTFQSTFGYVDVRTMLDGNSLPPSFSSGSWDFGASWTGGSLTVPGSPSNPPANAYNSSDALAAFTAGTTSGTALWAIAYNAGNYANGFSGSTQWAVITATAPGSSSNDWIYPSGANTENIQLLQINLASELIVGKDGSSVLGGNANNIYMVIPEPSSASLLALGVAGLVALRARRKR